MSRRHHHFTYITCPIAVTDISILESESSDRVLCVNYPIRRLCYSRMYHFTLRNRILNWNDVDSELTDVIVNDSIIRNPWTEEDSTLLEISIVTTK